MDIQVAKNYVWIMYQCLHADPNRGYARRFDTRIWDPYFERMPHLRRRYRQEFYAEPLASLLPNALRRKLAFFQEQYGTMDGYME